MQLLIRWDITSYLSNVSQYNILQVLDEFPEEKPADGCCIYGLFVEGCRWNPEIRLLDESKPKELYTGRIK